jgi:glycerol-3-phosphate acyltransferase PlsY
MALAYAFPLLGYLMGSLASAIIVCRAMGLPDPRSVGSGNPGATNVLRLGGRKAAALTLAGDVLKGVAPVLAAHALAVPDPALALTALGAFLGHLYPVFFRFQGGKGVATALGAIAALSWPVGLAFAPAFAWVLTVNGYHAAVLAVVAVLIAWRHRANIRRLLDGSEGRIGQKSTG